MSDGSASQGAAATAAAAEPIDIDRYLERIALKARPPATAEGLQAVQRAHRLTIPFENLDVAMRRAISLDPAALFEKLVVRRRGGYCFEQNGLFLAALHALGFEARPLLARVWLGAVDPPPKTHTFSLVTVDGEQWIADPGFGGSYTPPMRLADGETVETLDGVRHRLRADPEFGWLLERLGPSALTDGRGADEGWVAQYSFTLDPVYPPDLALANHWTSTAPDSRFTNLVVASLVLPSGFASLTGRDYSRRTGGQTVTAEIASATAYQLRLNFLFGIRLTADEIGSIGLFDAPR